ncbi:ABC transporter substrate-binding protein [Paenibacillus gorillae]|uniref:ABC transporter substrate-binding protein n=1 Tax=Paenibacillus gorillae TaxID=1243662 RepID=UPI0004BC134A|nr:ABC transporter substrate-binding protein [Paenibacillus gorillae]
MSKSFKRSAIAVSTILLLLLAACSSQTEPGTAASTNKPEATAAKRITVAVTQDSKGEKIDASTYNGARAVHSAIYDPLVEFGEGGKIEPGLATAWEVSEDGKTYTFHLREDVEFSDGSEFNAEAVKFSLARTVANEENASLEIARKLDKVETSDAHTVVLQFKEMATQVLLELSQARPFRMMSPNAVNPAGAVDGEFVKPIGTGPWQLDSFKEGAETVLTANEHYWKEKPSPYKLVFKVITDPQARVLALQNGEIDIAGGEVGNIPYESLPIFENNTKYTVEQHASTMSYFMVINQKNTFLADKNVRQAINLGTDTSKMMNGQGAEVSGLFQSTVAFVTPDNQPSYGFKPDKAKQLLEASGFQWNAGSKQYEKDGKPIQLRLVIQTEEYPEWKEMAEIFQSEMKNIGIKVDIANLERAAYYDALWTNKEYDLLLYRTYTDAQLPYRFLTSLFYHTDKTPGVAYQDEALTKQLDDIAKTTSTAEQQAIFDRIFGRMHEEAMTVPIYYTKQTFIHSKKIGNFAFGDIEDNPVKWHQLTIEE